MINMVAEKLRFKRKELKLSQKELANGICEQSQISKIERGHLMPSADLLFKLSQRLEVPLDYFFNKQIEVKSNLSSFKHLATRLLNDRNYMDLEYLYQLEVNKNNLLSLEDQMYLTWVKAIINFYQYDSRDKAITLLETALSKLAPDTLVYLKILNTLANFYSLVDRSLDYENRYRQLITLYKTRDLDSQEFLFGYLRIRYNHAYYLLSRNRNQEAIQEALEVIDFCKSKQTSYQLAPLLILVANASSEFLDKEKVKNYYIEARDLCKIYGNQLTLMKIEAYLSELDNETKS